MEDSLSTLIKILDEIKQEIKKLDNCFLTQKKIDRKFKIIKIYESNL
jgi:hypothetical protein